MIISAMVTPVSGMGGSAGARVGTSSTVIARAIPIRTGAGAPP